MTLEEILKEKQAELQMGACEFSLYLKMSRMWYANFRNPNIPKRAINEKTAYRLHAILDIPMQVINEYNKRIIESSSNR